MIDYARIYGLKTVVFRQSCIYGEHQFGVEDQGWIAWFTIASMLGRPITIYGNGKQVRDVLYVGDLIQLYDIALQRAGEISGAVYNVGGGPRNTLFRARVSFPFEIGIRRPDFARVLGHPRRRPAHIRCRRA